MDVFPHAWADVHPLGQPDQNLTLFSLEDEHQIEKVVPVEFSM
jgi:hypothetical protein